MSRVTTDFVEHGHFIIRHTEDVGPLLDALKEQRNHNDGHWRKNAARWRKAAEVPAIIVEKWLREDGFNCMAPGNEEETLKRVQRDYPYLLGVNKL